jgi:general secretion pathway protein G
MRHNRVGQILLGRSGFTLIELLVVIIILGLLAALVGPRVMGNVGTAKIRAAESQIELFSHALDQYRLDVGVYPSSQEGLQALRVNPGADGWNGPYLQKDVPLDPWSNPYAYQYPGTQGDFDIISHGRDKAPGGEGEDADVVSW